jgi:hypothetical protein
LIPQGVSNALRKDTIWKNKLFKQQKATSDGGFFLLKLPDFFLILWLTACFPRELEPKWLNGGFLLQSIAKYPKITHKS